MTLGTWFKEDPPITHSPLNLTLDRLFRGQVERAMSDGGSSEKPGSQSHRCRRGILLSPHLCRQHGYQHYLSLYSREKTRSSDQGSRLRVIYATPPFVNPVKCFMFGELVTKPVVQNRVVPLGTSMNHTSAACTDLEVAQTDSDRPSHSDLGLHGLTFRLHGPTLRPRTARTDLPRPSDCTD